MELGQLCTLNGEQAIINGRYGRYGRVTAFQSGLMVTLAWSTIVRVLATDKGRFVA